MTNQSLTSDQIVKILCGQLGALVEWNGAQPICEAIDWIADNRNDLQKTMVFAENRVANGAELRQMKDELKASLGSKQ